MAPAPFPSARDEPLGIDAGGDVASSPPEFEASAIRAEADGYDGIVATETRHDPFVGLSLAARATTRLRLASGIAVAFARNPMTTAMIANDVQTVAEGRFVLGLGSQIQPHIERRFSMPWSAPARRMRDYVGAIRAIWSSWSTGERLTYRGEFYSHTLMTPFFDPGPNPHGTPPVLLAAVGERMTEVAGAVADGLIAHSFTTDRYLREVSLPALRRGWDSADRTETSFEITVPAFVTLGRDQAELDAAARSTRKQIAFYGSTPSYRGVLETHGWGDVADRLHGLSRRGGWDEMGRLITDDMLTAFSAVGTPDEVARQLVDRFGGLATRLSFNAPYELDPAVFTDLVASLRRV